MRRFIALLSLTVAGAAGLAAQEFLILPFTNNSGVSGLDWLGEGASEMLGEFLAASGSPVVSRDVRDELIQRRGGAVAALSKAGLLKLGEELGCAYLVHGEFGLSRIENAPLPPQGNVRLTARLIDLDRYASRALEEEGPLAQLSAIQARLAWRLLRHARAERVPPKEQFLEGRPPAKTEALESYVRGIQAATPEQKHRHFTQAALLDPEFSEPRFQLGLMQWEERLYRGAAQWLERVAAHDSHYFEAHFLLGLCRYHLGDAAGAVEAFDRVARARPANEVLNNLALSRLLAKDHRAWQTLWKVMEAEADDADYQFNAGYLLWKQGDLQGAQERFRAALKLDPSDLDAQLLLERCLGNNGPRRGDLSDEGLERLKENYQSAGINAWKTMRNEAE
ncbi:MAG: tetratricopeptide repeat protein [Bryobacteraceae bacterium]|nr:tetratricopeptide repeat protein [Bryobacteraceae bacterium]